jgi:hypothetical protein
MGGGSYSAFRTLAKLGGYFANGSFTAGVSLTTPSLHITGSGEFGVNDVIVTPDTTVLVADVQTDLDAKFKSPLSVGLGLGWEIGRVHLNASAEWFDGIDPYVVMEGEDFAVQEPAGVDRYDVVHAMDNVLNWGVGVGYELTGSVTGFASYATDHAGVTDDIERADLSVAPFDLRSAFLGTEFEVRLARVTIGAGYMWGSDPAEAIADLIGDEDLDPIYVYHRFRLLFGFELITN